MKQVNDFLFGAIGLGLVSWALYAVFWLGHWEYAVAFIVLAVLGAGIYDKLHGYKFSDEGWKQEGH